MTEVALIVNQHIYTRVQALQLIWRHTHPDFKGMRTSDGKRTILVNRGGEGTCLVELDVLTDADIMDELPYAVSCEARQQQRTNASKLVRGARIVSKAAECDDGDDGPRETGPNAIGTVVAVFPEQEERYGVGFENGTSVLLTIDELADPAQYELLD